MHLAKFLMLQKRLVFGFENFQFFIQKEALKCFPVCTISKCQISLDENSDIYSTEEKTIHLDNKLKDKRVIAQIILERITTNLVISKQMVKLIGY